MIYLDNAATTKPDDEVVDAMLPYLRDDYGNAGTLYDLGESAANAVCKARMQVAGLINASPEQIIFTSGGTESNNMVFAGNCRGKHILRVLTEPIEHESVLNSVNKLSNIEAYYASVERTGRVSLEDIERILRKQDSEGQPIDLVSIMFVNNETGIKNPIYDIERLAHAYWALFHVDCVQAASCCRIDVKEMNCDFLSLSSHKIHGPKGVGALYVKNPEKMSPMIHGGRYQEFGLRGGTENVPGIVGFGKACEIMDARIDSDIEYIKRLRDYFLTLVLKGLKSRGLDGIMHINGEYDQASKVINLGFDGVDGETLLRFLNNSGICVSAGSACRSLEQEPSYVLTAMGISPEDARNSIRISFSRMNTRGEIEEAAEIISNAVAFLYDLGRVEEER